MATKRNLSSCSEPEIELKKVNLKKTPIKVMGISHIDTTHSPEENKSNRKDAIKEVKKNAPEWFASAFDFMLKDLANISNQVHEVKLCKEQCQNNSAEIERLQKKVTELEHKNQTLESQITKLEDYSRNHNLIIKGLPETGPKKNKKLFLN